jgi:hypothetical protein
MRRGTAGINGVMMRRRMMGGRVIRIRTDGTMRITGRNGECLFECDMTHNIYFNLSHLF